MKILTRLRDANGRATSGIDYVLIDFTTDYVNRLLDYKGHFERMRELPHPPLPLWLTLSDLTPKFFNIGAIAEGHPWFQYQQQIAANQFVELPEHYDPVVDTLIAGAIVAGTECHLTLSDDGVSWCLLISGRAAGSAILPYTLLYRAAGAMMPEPIAADAGSTDAPGLT